VLEILCTLSRCCELPHISASMALYSAPETVDEVLPSRCVIRLPHYGRSPHFVPTFCFLGRMLLCRHPALSVGRTLMKFSQWAPCRSRKPVPFTDSCRHIGPMSDAPSHPYHTSHGGPVGWTLGRIAVVRYSCRGSERLDGTPSRSRTLTLVLLLDDSKVSHRASLWDLILLDRTRSLCRSR
jgi:hypothetical protein